jgi:hypothetical protein
MHPAAAYRQQFDERITERFAAAPAIVEWIELDPFAIE